MRLLSVELRRVGARRLVLGAVLGAVLAGLFVLLSAWQATRPLSESDLAQAEAHYAEAMAYWEEFGEQDIALCEEERAEYREATGTEPEWTCDFEEPELEWFISVAPPLEEAFAPYLANFGMFLLVVALVIGATFTAAELSTGAMSTWLTFEPRRVKVYISKVLAPALAVLPVALALLAVVGLGVWAIHAQAGLAGGMTAAHWGQAAGLGARIAALTVLAVLLSAALGVLLRHTAGVLGAVIGYVVLEQFVAALFGRLQPYLVSVNVRGWFEDGTSYYIETCTTDLTGTMCDFVEHTIGVAHSAVYLLALTAAVVVVSGAVFRVRDLH